MAYIQPFHVQLNAVLKSNNLNCESASRFIEIKTGRKICGRSMRHYVLGESVPDYFKAKDILEAFDFRVDEMELQKSLEMSKQERTIKEMDKLSPSSIRKTIRIRLKGMIEGLQSDDVERLLTERVSGLFDDADAISQYINKLIKEDLENYLNEEEKNDN